MICAPFCGLDLYINLKLGFGFLVVVVVMWGCGGFCPLMMGVS